MSAHALRIIAREATGWSITVSILMIIAGILAIAIPPAAGIAVVIVVGWLLTFSGAMHLIFAWHTRTAGGMTWELLLGLLYMFVGIYAWLHPVAGLASITLFLAIYLFVEGILEFILFYRLRRLPGSFWLVLDGVVTLLLAVLILRSWPSGTGWVIGTLVGISMLFSGTSRLALSVAAHRAAASLP
jgi:uncharacterized membrane protein HdeD (DUF308 family)